VGKGFFIEISTPDGSHRARTRCALAMGVGGIVSGLLANSFMTSPGKPVDPDDPCPLRLK
jgi:hypothetical protein